MAILPSLSVTLVQTNFPRQMVGSNFAIRFDDFVKMLEAL